MKYRMIALDLDGTLNNDDHVITPKTREALIAVQERFSPTAMQYVVGGNFMFHGQHVLFT